MGEETARATERIIRYRPIEPVRVKGKDEPLPALLAVEATAGPREHHLTAGPMVGRDAELHLLRTSWERVRSEGAPHLVTVLGPPGIGKTRLYRELAEVVRAGGGRTLAARSLPYGERTGFGAFAQQLRGLAEIFETDPAPLAREKLARTIARLLPGEDGEVVTGQLAQMIGLSGEGAADRGALLLSARRFVEAVALETPTMFVFEDLHWSDPSLLDLVEALAARCRDAPVFMLALARPELLDRRPHWGGGLRSHTTLALPDLVPADSRRLLASLLPGIADPLIVTRLVDTAEGNPLFLEELGTSFVERATEITADLPRGVTGIIAARLDALPPAERGVLLDASVVGKIFWSGALRRLSGGADLPHILESLEARDLIRRERRSGIEGDEQFAFKHMLTREVAYATLPRAGRRQRHGVVARFLEEAAGDRLGETASLLAHHWQEAGDGERAVHYLLLAAGSAGRAWAKGEAVALYDHALELVPEDNIERRRAVRLRRAIMRMEAADYQRAAAELDALIPELAGRERIEALVARARCAQLDHDAGVTLAAAQKAADLARAVGEKDLLGPALAVLSMGTNLTGRVAEALTVAEKALAAWPSGRTGSDLALHLGITGLECYFLGRHEDALAYGRRGHRIAEDVHHGESLLFAGGQVALGLAGLGRHEEALAFLEPLVAQGLELGTVGGFTARAMNIWGWVLTELFAFEESRQRNHEAAELATRVPFPIAEVQSGVDLLFTDLAAGEAGRAEAAWGSLWEAGQSLKGFHQWLVMGRLEAARAEISLQCGRLEAAADEAATALASAQRVGRVRYEVASRVVLGSALVAMDKAPDGISELRAALAGAEGLGHPPSLWRAAAALGRACAAVADDEAAEAAFRTAHDAVHRFAAGLSGARREAFLSSPALAVVLEPGP